MLLEIIAGLLVLGALLVPWIVCVQKGKTGLVVVGLVLSVFGVVFVAMWIGAVRLAKPGSAWARRRLDPAVEPSGSLCSFCLEFPMYEDG